MAPRACRFGDDIDPFHGRRRIIHGRTGCDHGRQQPERVHRALAAALRVGGFAS